MCRIPTVILNIFFLKAENLRPLSLCQKRKKERKKDIHFSGQRPHRRERRHKSEAFHIQHKSKCHIFIHVRGYARPKYAAGILPQHLDGDELGTPCYFLT